ncbi:hypothetical protein BH24ACT24_BH24ACT24_02620 [soil metagenome]
METDHEELHRELEKEGVTSRSAATSSSRTRRAPVRT